MLALFQAEPGYFITLLTLAGLAIGSFLNVVIHRLPKMMEQEWRDQCAWLAGASADAARLHYNLAHPPSSCPACGHGIRWFENIPVLSWLALRGRCSGCRAPISPRYPLVEILTGALFGYAAWRWGASFQTVAACCLLACLVALACIDLDTMLLPDSMTLPLAWAGLLVNLFGIFTPLEDAVIGGVAGYLSLWLVFHLFRLLTGKEDMGFGDFKLLSALGAWLGWQMLLPIVLIASFAGALIGLMLIAMTRHGREKPIPFGPWLALGGVVSLFWGGPLLRLWLGG
ncbi:MAG: prepilin peptidase [Betaproteobacteria bacterium]|nr:prepilin peptidase [Betaproteobacteria bacterium]